MFAIKTIPYSEFLKLLKENKVTEVAISANQIQGKINDTAAGKEQMFRTVRVDPDTSKLLEQYNDNFKGEIESRFLATLLSWVVPVFLFFGLWYFLMKRMAGQQPGFMTLGKNKAKIYMQEDISTGAHNDLARATDIARSMVKEYGMSNKIGQVYFAREKRSQFLNIPMEGAGEYSEATAELIDTEVREIINVQYSRAIKIIGEKREILVKGAKILLEKEKIEGEELKALIDVTSI